MGVIKKISRLCRAWTKYLLAFSNVGGVKDSKCWVFGEWGGYIRGDNSACLANYAAERDPGLNLYWISRKDNKLNLNILDSRIKVLEYGSIEAENILKKAGAIFFSVSFLDVSPCPYNFYGKAVSVNLRHDSPFKNGRSRNFIYKFYVGIVNKIIRARYLLSISDEFTKLRISEFEPGKVINAGFPRDELLYSEKYLQEAKKNLTEKIHRDYNTKIIAYMPTWRYNGDEIPELKKVFSPDFIDWLEKNNIVVIHKSHFVTECSNLEKDRSAKSSQIAQNIIKMNDISASELLAASDILITDYSSCVWDYLILDRPVIHFAYDYEIFKTTGMGGSFICDFSEIAFEEMNCGSIVSNSEDLQKAIIDGISFPDSQKELRRQRRERFMTYEKPGSCEKIFDFVVRELEKQK